ncbi:MAG: F0F1 ATP synthase subunit B [Actinomycetota bacterium]
MTFATRLMLLAQEHAEEADPTRLVLPEVDELIWGTIAFGLLFILLAKVAFPRLREGLANREQAIRAELERAEQARLESESKREEYDRRLAEARTEADNVIREATEAAEALRRERVARGEDEARQIVEKARTEAASERDRAFGELQRTIADLSLEAARRVLENELSDEAAQRQLVEQFIASASSGRNN